MENDKIAPGDVVEWIGHSTSSPYGLISLITKNEVIVTWHDYTNDNLWEMHYHKIHLNEHHLIKKITDTAIIEQVNVNFIKARLLE